MLFNRIRVIVSDVFNRIHIGIIDVFVLWLYILFFGYHTVCYVRMTIPDLWSQVSVLQARLDWFVCDSLDSNNYAFFVTVLYILLFLLVSNIPQ